MGGCEVEDEVMRADSDDGVLNVVQRTEKLDVDLGARVVAFRPGRHDQ